MANTRTLMNKVLRGIRQFGLIIPDATTSTTDDYLLMILQFVNEAKEEIEEAGHAWMALRKTVTLTLAASTVEYDLTIAGSADVDTTERTRLLYVNVRGEYPYSNEGFFTSTNSVPQVYDVTDSDEFRLDEWTQEKMERAHFLDNDETDAQVTAFALYSDGDSLKIKVWPTPTGARTLKLRMYVPQAELSSTDLTTTLTIPARQTWLFALFKANQERGDELGKEGSVLHTAYLNAHGSAVSREQTPEDITIGLDR